MVKALEIRGGGLKCDATGCGYIDESIPFSDYEKWIGAPCPKCGASLLTEADFRATQLIRSVVDLVNAIMPVDAEKRESPRTLIHFNFDGSGSVGMEIEEIATAPSEDK